MDKNPDPKRTDPFLVAICDAMQTEGMKPSDLAKKAGALREGGEYAGKPYSQQAMSALLNHNDGGITMKVNVAMAAGFISYHAALDRGKELLQNKGQKPQANPEAEKMNLGEIFFKLGEIQGEMKKEFEAIHRKLDRHIGNDQVHVRHAGDKKNSL